MKYEEQGGPALRDLAGLLRNYGDPADVTRLLRRTTFNMAVGNADAHAKNFSVLHDTDSPAITLAPLYDVLSTIALELTDGAGQPMQADTHLGQRVGGQADIRKVTTASLIDEAAAWGIRRRTAASVVAETLDRVLAAIPQTPGDERVLAVIRKQAEQLARARALKLVSGMGEQAGEHGRGFGRGADFQVHLPASEVEAEVEEGTALLFGGSQPGDLGCPVRGQGQPHPVGDRLTFGAGEQVLPLADPVARCRAVKRAGHRGAAPRFAAGAPAGLVRCRRPLVLTWPRRQGPALRAASSVLVRQGVQVLTGAVQSGGERRQLAGALLGFGDPHGQARAQAVAYLSAGAVRPHGQQFSDLLQRQPESLGTGDEAEALHGVLVVDPVAAGGAAGGRMPALS